MAKILVHVTHGPENPTRAALAFLVARSALDEGHSVSMFLGTGSLRELFDALVATGVRFYASGMSGKSRGVTDADLAGKSAEFAMPNVLVRLCIEHDKMFTY
jgi:predicted peroxiredoxin